MFSAKGFLLCIVAFVAISCSSLPDAPWYNSLPNTTVGIYIPETGATIKQVIESNAGSFFDDITSSALPILQDIERASSQNLQVKAITFYPSESDQMQTVWILNNSGSAVKKLKAYFTRPLFVDEYFFEGTKIHKLSVDNRLFFLIENSDYLFISESSKAIEGVISTVEEKIPALSISKSIESRKNVFLLNLDKLDLWVSQYNSVKYNPVVNQAFKGLGLGIFDYTFDSSGDLSFSFSGAFPTTDSLSTIAKAISTRNSTLTLDQYIPTDAATFSIHFSPVKALPIIKPISPLDEALRSSPSLIQSLVSVLDDEVAFVGFPPAGIAGVGENLLIRKVTYTRALYEWLRNAESKGLISSIDNTYYVHSGYLASIIGSGLAYYETFYLGITSEAVVISPRLGLTNRVKSDRSRRRVISYSQTYIDVRSTLPEQVSTLFYADSKLFSSYIQRYLNTSNTINAFTTKFELIAGATQIESDKNISITINGYTKKRSTQPFEEQWIAPMDGATIVGQPVLADIGGSSRKEIIVANSMRRVLGIANDGTTYFSADTGTDTPIGSPVVYDWYGNGQSAILVAAGNKVYAWNTAGNALPKFPFELSEAITAPLVLADINRDGIAEVIVTTADRKIHVLDGRGEELKGWPVSTSGEIRIKPHYDYINSKWILFAFADNGIYGFDAQGRLVDGFPTFITSSFSSNPVTIQAGLMIGAADGHLYRIGSTRMFSDSLNVLRNTAYDSLAPGLRLSARYISNDAINAKPIYSKLQIKTDSITVYTEDMLITQSANGGIFALNTLGELRFATSMGQTSSSQSDLILEDLQNDKRPEILAVAGFGRLYAWELYSGTRYYDLPTSAIDFPILADLDGDGFPELIGQTRGGLRCWSIFGNKEVPRE